MDQNITLIDVSSEESQADTIRGNQVGHSKRLLLPVIGVNKDSCFCEQAVVQFRRMKLEAYRTSIESILSHYAIDHSPNLEWIVVS